MARRNHLPPFELELDALGPRGVAVGTAPDGRAVAVRGAPPGARIAVVPTGRSKGGWTARRTATVRPPAAMAAPRCAQFGLCGGCTLQELDLAGQRAAKQALALAEIGAATPLEGVRVHPIRGADAAYGYRNKVELSFGVRRYVSEADKAAGAPLDGRFLGFHAPGRFDRVVDAPRCELVSEGGNEVLARVRAVALAPDAPPPRDPQTHQGFWRHLGLREHHGGRLVVVYTADDRAGAPWVERIAQDLDGLAATVEWRVGDHVADVARGEVARRWGPATVDERLLGKVFALSATAFFQTNTPGTEVLYRTVGEALQADGGTLWDLYCGVGSIGIVLADRFERVRGVEENPESVRDAGINAMRNEIDGEYRTAKVEDVLPDVAGDVVVVDPPRAGLHPKVAAAVGQADWRALVYVACNPAALGRDAEILRAGGARLTDLWPVDLFPQTGHVEVVARFERDRP
ncbi:MAG: 23S rRNA (uracil(1939)-C(5))-methyltransferase RlmD [Myxococcota bacterium]